MALQSHYVQVVRGSDELTRLQRHTDQSAANTPLTINVPTCPRPRRIISVAGVWTGGASGTCTVQLDCGDGATFDVVLQVIAATTYQYWLPNNDALIAEDDTLKVIVPAAGAGVQCALVVFLEEL